MEEEFFDGNRIKNYIDVLEAVQAIGQCLLYHIIPVSDIINHNAIPFLIKCLGQHDSPLLQLEAAFALTDVSAGSSSQTADVVVSGAVPIALRMLESPHQDINQQAIWILGNIMGDNPDFRDLVLKHDVVPSLVSLLDFRRGNVFLKVFSWAIENMCCYVESPVSTEVAKQLMPVLHKLILHGDRQVARHSVRALSSLACSCNDADRLLVQKGIIPHLVPLLNIRNVRMDTLQLLGNLAAGDESHCQVVVENDVLEQLPELLSDHNKEIIEETLWFLSNITAGSEQRIQAVIDSGLIPIVVKLLKKRYSPLHEEAAYFVYNLTQRATATQISYLIEQKVVPVLCDILIFQYDYPLVLQAALRALNNILMLCGPRCEYDEMRLNMIINGSLKPINSARSHTEEAVRDVASEILLNHFPDHLDGLSLKDSDENLGLGTSEETVMMVSFRDLE